MLVKIPCNLLFTLLHNLVDRIQYNNGHPLTLKRQCAKSLAILSGHPLPSKPVRLNCLRVLINSTEVLWFDGGSPVIHFSTIHVLQSYNSKPIRASLKPSPREEGLSEFVVIVIDAVEIPWFNGGQAIARTILPSKFYGNQSKVFPAFCIKPSPTKVCVLHCEIVSHVFEVDGSMQMDWANGI